MSRDPDEARTTASFLRGLTIGALLGAVLAGSSIWSRRRRAAARDEASSAPSDPPRLDRGPAPGP